MVLRVDQTPTPVLRGGLSPLNLTYELNHMIFDTFYDIDEIFHVSMQNSVINHHVGFDPLFLTNFTITNDSNYKLADHEVTLQNIENGWIRTFTTNQDGMISEYLREGDWLVVVPDFESESDSFEGLREIIQVSYNGIVSQEFNLQTKKCPS